jgi:hypothetical protein
VDNSSWIEPRVLWQRISVGGANVGLRQMPRDIYRSLAVPTIYVAQSLTARTAVKWLEKRSCECYAVVKKNTTGCFPTNWLIEPGWRSRSRGDAQVWKRIRPPERQILRLASYIAAPAA